MQTEREGPLKRLLIIRNPAAGQRRARDFGRAMEVLERVSDCDVVETGMRGDATRFAREADPARYDAVVAAGGDGTINEAVNGLAGGALPLGVIPLGTSNVLAHEIGVGSDVLRAAETIVAGRVRRIALADADGHFCCLMASAGYDARAITRVRPWLKRLAGEGAYYIAGLEELLAGSRTMLEVEVDGQRFQASSVVIANGRLYGGKYLCAPHADLAEPLLHTVLMQQTGRWNITRYGIALMRGMLHRLPDVRIVPGTRVRLLGPAGEPWQSDGDLIGRLPVTVTAAPDAIGLLVPPEAR